MFCQDGGGFFLPFEQCLSLTICLEQNDVSLGTSRRSGLWCDVLRVWTRVLEGLARVEHLDVIVIVAKNDYNVEWEHKSLRACPQRDCDVHLKDAYHAVHPCTPPTAR